MTAAGSFVAIPRRVNDLLSSDSQFQGSVLLSLNAFEPWISDNKLPFFPEFTDHGPRHISEVLATAASIITDRAWDVMTAGDAAALTLSVLLHDSAMHLTEDGFVWLIQQSEPRLGRYGDLPWNLLWQMFLGEVSRWDERRIEDVFGHRNRTRRPPNDPSQLTVDDRRLIGEFVRRHHARLAHEIAIWGIPGVNGRVVACQGLQPQVLELIGLIARSHNLPIRRATDFLDPDDCRDPFGIHAPFLMGVLRIADYLQIHAERAPGALLHLRSLRSPISSSEWSTHLAVQAINNTQNDPEAIYIRATPPSASIFLKLRALLDSIQMELDETWATLGEVYGRFGSLSDLGLGIRRVRSNIDDLQAFGEQVSYIPRHAAFESAGADLLKLLIKPLYGDQPEIGIRELIQNAVDAVRERIDLDQSAREELPIPEVAVDLVRHKDSLGEIIIRDHGVGMTAEVITGFFLRAGASFRRSMEWRQQHTTDAGDSRVLRSGRFGIGALAAFLLAERIEVTTRHISEPHGICFSASIDDSVIEMWRVDSDIGTTIRVTISDPAVMQRLTASPNTWDWYCCETPAVRRTIDGVELPRQFTCPAAVEKLPTGWRRIRSGTYTDVQWTYAIGDHPILFCNGIRIGRSASASSSISGGRAFLYYPRTTDLTVYSPSVSVFDADANLPLDLQRTSLATAHYPFRGALLASVLTDFAAFAAINAPHDPRELLSSLAIRLNYPGINANVSGGMPWLWFWHSPAGLALSDAWAFGTLRPSRIIVLNRLSSLAANVECIPFENEFVVPFECRVDRFKETEQWLRWAFGEPTNGFGPVGRMKATGARALVTTACIEAMSSKKKGWAITRVAGAMVAGAQRLSADWYLISQGPIGAPALDYEALASVQPASKYEAIAEVYINHEPAPQPESPPARVWQQLIGAPIIPYDVVARQRLIKNFPNAEYTRANQERRAEIDREAKLSTNAATDDENE